MLDATAGPDCADLPTLPMLDVPAATPTITTASTSAAIQQTAQKARLISCQSASNSGGMDG